MLHKESDLMESCKNLCDQFIKLYSMCDKSRLDAIEKERLESLESLARTLFVDLSDYKEGIDK